MSPTVNSDTLEYIALLAGPTISMCEVWDDAPTEFRVVLMFDAMRFGAQPRIEGKRQREA